MRTLYTTHSWGKRTIMCDYAGLTRLRFIMKAMRSVLYPVLLGAFIHGASVLAQTNVPSGMALVPAGSFLMGDSVDGDSNAPTSTVYVSAFYMDTNLVSYALWQQIYQWGALRCSSIVKGSRSVTRCDEADEEAISIGWRADPDHLTLGVQRAVGERACSSIGVGVMRAQRSMVFYAWLGLVVEFVLVLGVVAFVLAGAGYQRSAILLLSRRVPGRRRFRIGSQPKPCSSAWRTSATG